MTRPAVSTSLVGFHFSFSCSCSNRAVFFLSFHLLTGQRRYAEALSVHRKQALPWDLWSSDSYVFLSFTYFCEMEIETSSLAFSNSVLKNINSFNAEEARNKFLLWDSEQIFCCLFKGNWGGGRGQNSLNQSHISNNVNIFYKINSVDLSSRGSNNVW